jgi:hypothetical protein
MAATAKTIATSSRAAAPGAPSIPFYRSLSAPQPTATVDAESDSSGDDAYLVVTRGGSQVTLHRQPIADLAQQELVPSSPVPTPHTHNPANYSESGGLHADMVNNNGGGDTSNSGGGSGWVPTSAPTTGPRVEQAPAPTYLAEDDFLRRVREQR